MDCSLPGSSVHGILQARILEWVAVPLLLGGDDPHQGIEPASLTSPALAGDVRDAGSIPGPERSLGEGNGKPLQYSCPENPMNREAWWDRVHGSQESDMTEAT